MSSTLRCSIWRFRPAHQTTAGTARTRAAVPAGAEGGVVPPMMTRVHAAKRDVKASEGDPQYLVKSDKSGGEAVTRLTH